MYKYVALVLLRTYACGIYSSKFLAHTTSTHNQTITGSLNHALDAENTLKLHANDRKIHMYHEKAHCNRGSFMYTHYIHQQGTPPNRGSAVHKHNHLTAFMLNSHVHNASLYSSNT